MTILNTYTRVLQATTDLPSTSWASPPIVAAGGTTDNLGGKDESTEIQAYLDEQLQNIELRLNKRFDDFKSNFFDAFVAKMDEMLEGKFSKVMTEITSKLSGAGPDLTDLRATVKDMAEKQQQWNQYHMDSVNEIRNLKTKPAVDEDAQMLDEGGEKEVFVRNGTLMKFTSKPSRRNRKITQAEKDQRRYNNLRKGFNDVDRSKRIMNRRKANLPSREAILKMEDQVLAGKMKRAYHEKCRENEAFVRNL